MKLLGVKNIKKTMSVKEAKFNGNTLKRGNRIIGYVGETEKEGWAYYIGKPSNRSVARFTGKEPLTEVQAKERLMNAFTL